MRPLLFELGVAGHAGSAELNRAQLRSPWRRARSVGCRRAVHPFQPAWPLRARLRLGAGHRARDPFAHQHVARAATETWLLNAFGGGAGGTLHDLRKLGLVHHLRRRGPPLSSSELALFDFGSGGCAPSLLRGGSFGGTGTSRDASRSRSTLGRCADACLRPFAAASGVVPSVIFPPRTCRKAPAQRGRLQTESQPLRLLEALSLHTGRQSPLPEWTDDGVILGVQGAPSRARI